MCIRPRRYSPCPRPTSASNKILARAASQKLMGESLESVDPYSWMTVTLAGGGVTIVKTHPHYGPKYRRQMVELTRTDRTPGVMDRLDRLGQRLIRRDGRKLLHRHRKCKHRDDRRRGLPGKQVVSPAPEFLPDVSYGGFGRPSTDCGRFWRYALQPRRPPHVVGGRTLSRCNSIRHSGKQSSKSGTHSIGTSILVAEDTAKAINDLVAVGWR